ncbi:MFS transporter [Croceicoccus ponticola]|uniref:MFS transporter n=2 Tax=Croceicoccus ponticola TaxID=2217664 RepID=A0A437GXH7_9SPHN|nr:MFS transporter [Croceicoccus ponticola]RVQ66601.1 MFS transporter [Croceicoccus ponticola]
MHWRQILVVVICIALNALDGFDVLAISFAAPGIAREWSIDPAVLGVVLSMELIGMAAGSVLLGNVADRIGRRPTILLCLAVMAVGMLASALATSVTMLSATRLFTGLGIGGMLSATSAMVAEYSNARRRGLNVSLNIAGYSTGAIFGGLVASYLLESSGEWRSVFVFGGIATLVMLPLAAVFVPESVQSLAARRPAGALARINRTLGKLGHEHLSHLPELGAGDVGQSILTLFSKRFAAVTVLLTIAYFAQIMLFYFVMKWVPKIVADMGFADADAGRVLVAANVGNLAAAVLIGLASQRFTVRPLVIAAMVAGSAAIAVFGTGLETIATISISVAVAAFFINAGVVGLYPILAQTFPANLRGSGIGFVIGVGRGGSAVGPVIAGGLFASGAGLLTVALVMGAGGLVAATMLVLLPRALRAAPPTAPG